MLEVFSCDRFSNSCTFEQSRRFLSFLQKFISFFKMKLFHAFLAFIITAVYAVDINEERS